MPIRSADKPGAFSRPAAAIIGLLAVLLIGALVWGGTTAQSLSSSQAQLATTAQQLSAANSDLTASKSEAAQLGAADGQLTADNAQLTADKSNLASSLAQAKDQVSKQTACISALQANASELQRISQLATTNFNRTAKGSAWAKADSAAINDYYNAYLAAFHGKLSTANSWIVKGNAAIKTKSAQVKIIDAATKTIDAAESALTAAITGSAATCGF